MQQIFREQVQLHLRNLTGDEARQLSLLMEKVLSGLLEEKAQLEHEMEKNKDEKGVYENEKNNQS